MFWMGTYQLTVGLITCVPLELKDYRFILEQVIFSHPVLILYVCVFERDSWRRWYVRKEERAEKKFKNGDVVRPVLPFLRHRSYLCKIIVSMHISCPLKKQRIEQGVAMT